MLQKELLSEIEAYISLHLHNTIDLCLEAPQNIYNEELVPNELEDFITINRKPTLNQILFQFIDEKGVNDSAVYKKAGLDRRHFSKIRSNPDYHPKKPTLISLALALELDRDDAEDLLNTAGYSLSESETFDLIIQFCLNKKIYDLHIVNEILHYYELKPLNA
ncbi:hypothetical protein LCM10_12050 [Rossellomorea aquimaris]|uniref:hypothetical protein n=1 Tax=Rossellomorea aquimaris TaxID=189382 RepID=UPI001CD23B0D|nr:hypothetical protein [Rossellomorea aquimaris]MCA1055720.1 hypothetical protein [Rossellomorea aquimaris]